MPTNNRDRMRIEDFLRDTIGTWLNPEFDPNYAAGVELADSIISVRNLRGVERAKFVFTAEVKEPTIPVEADF